MKIQKTLKNLILVGALGIPNLSIADSKITNLVDKMNQNFENRNSIAKAKEEAKSKLNGIVEKYAKKGAIYNIQILGITPLSEEPIENEYYKIRIDLRISSNPKYVEEMLAAAKLAHQIPHSSEESSRFITIPLSTQLNILTDNEKEKLYKEFISTPAGMMNAYSAHNTRLPGSYEMNVIFNDNSVQYDIELFNPKSNSRLLDINSFTLCTDGGDCFLYTGSIDTYTVLYLTEEQIKNLKEIKPEMIYSKPIEAPKTEGMYQYKAIQQ